MVREENDDPCNKAKPLVHRRTPEAPRGADSSVAGSGAPAPVVVEEGSRSVVAPRSRAALTVASNSAASKPLPILRCASFLTLAGPFVLSPEQ